MLLPPSSLGSAKGLCALLLNYLWSATRLQRAHQRGWPFTSRPALQRFAPSSLLHSDLFGCFICKKKFECLLGQLHSEKIWAVLAARASGHFNNQAKFDASCREYISGITMANLCFAALHHQLQLHQQGRCSANSLCALITDADL